MLVSDEPPGLSRSKPISCTSGAGVDRLARADIWRRSDVFRLMPSSVIKSFDYDQAARRLDIEFVSGRRYSYLDVPARVAEAMRRAGSKGGFFNRRIRDRYRFVRA